MTWTCACGLEFKSFGRAQAHANAAHHGARITINVATRKRPSTAAQATVQVDGQALLTMMARALVDSPATCQLLIGMGVLERVKR